MVLSASAVTSRLPVTSKAAAKMPLSLSRLPGCTALAPAWKLLLLFQSQNLCVRQELRELMSGSVSQGEENLFLSQPLEPDPGCILI